MNENMVYLRPGIYPPRAHAWPSSAMIALLFIFLVIAAVSSIIEGTARVPVPLAWIAVIVSGVLALVFLAKAASAYGEEVRSYDAYTLEQERMKSARANFLYKRGVQVAPSTTGFWPDTRPQAEGVVSQAQAIVNGQATNVALHWQSGELVLCDADGREIQPLAVV